MKKQQNASKCGPSKKSINLTYATFWTHVHLIYNKPTKSFLINEQLQEFCIFKIEMSSITTNKYVLCTAQVNLGDPDFDIHQPR